MEYFGESLPDTLVAELLTESKHQYELEVLPLLLALQTRGNIVSGSPVLFFPRAPAKGSS